MEGVLLSTLSIGDAPLLDTGGGYHVFPLELLTYTLCGVFPADILVICHTF